MIKMSKKAIGAITGVSAALIAGTTVAVNLLMKNEKGAKTNNPLNRDKNYQYYSLINKISSNEKLNNLIGIQRTESSITYVIEEQRFIDNIRLIVQDALKEIPAFSEKYLNYVIDCHYKINTKSVLVDLV
ncbi:MAG: hypothetical protein MJ219_04160 [Mycoplasmoidaceae bacterium]|nr:hypothetical protein [Mycoplasmoidaceae bacterium]